MEMFCCLAWPAGSSFLSEGEEERLGLQVQEQEQVNLQAQLQVLVQVRLEGGTVVHLCDGDTVTITPGVDVNVSVTGWCL